MSGVAAAASPAVELMADYVAFVERLNLGHQARRLRCHAARRFLAAHPDLAQWMTRPTTARLVEVTRADAWPFLTWCFIEGHVHPDVDLLGAKTRGALFTTWASCHRHDVDRAVTVGRALGWAESWVHQVCVDALGLVCLTTGRGLGELEDDLLDGFAAELDAALAITAHHRRVITSRLGALRQVCFQLGLVDVPPPHPSARSRALTDRVAGMTQPEIRRVALRYLEVVSTTLRPSTVHSRADSIDLLGCWLAEFHPGLTSLVELRREHLEGFLAWNATRSWRGRVARDQKVSSTHAHHAVVDLKAFFEDLAIWGWAERPPAPGAAPQRPPPTPGSGATGPAA